ncbi:MAG: hypothetical protein QOE49_2822 [Rhodospirillaceae bacterium]|jgi:hypothetical protein|nr:hypothetical protein [Rhodospirillaceae bacterium]MEA2811007.1 hypothetical protein [Rhodospirillaceae bacterium]
MGDPTPEIEIELGRPIVTQQQAIDHRKKLNESFAKLSQEQAATLLDRLLKVDGSALPSNFRRLHRANRLALLNRLTMQLGTQTSERFHSLLTAAGDTPAKKGLRHLFPDYTKTERDKFLQGLVKKTPTGTPIVQLEFRSDGPFSPDNHAQLIVDRNVDSLQLGLLPDSGKNQMEIRGVVIGHRPDAEYRFNRVRQTKEWYRANDTWQFLHPPDSKPTNDNTHGKDEDDHPDDDHIYSFDAPGLVGPLGKPPFLASVPPPTDRSSVTEAVFMMNATETAEVKVGGGPWTKAAELEWFTVTWLEKVNGQWRRKPQVNTISEGSINNLDDPNALPDTVNW